MSAAVRPARPDDLPALVRLCAAHAEYEKLAPPAPDLSPRLAEALWGAASRAWCLVSTDADDQPIGYASFSAEFATWTGREFIHLDCLYLDEPYRGRGLGRALLEQVTAAARRFGATEVQWQTPDWNTAAIGFYKAVGARGRAKTRFTLTLTEGERQT